MENYISVMQIFGMHSINTFTVESLEWLFLPEYKSDPSSTTIEGSVTKEGLSIPPEVKFKIQ